ncbi:uridine kinase-like [Carettochelys insculpta]|uniref:uridine kinase-like n=1 Tax=Carettochelys insculpta TaxID=44489 RepID=UPI003EBAAE1C
MQRAPVIVAIAGGSCSGKTTLAQHLHTLFRSDGAVMVLEDFYYLSATQRGAVNVDTYNFDAPATKDFALLTAHMKLAKQGKPFDAPDYDFTTHDRLPKTRRIEPGRVVILEGLHNLLFDELRALADVTVFVEAGRDVRRARRIARDVADRGRVADVTARQFDMVVEPMHVLYVAPQRALAQHITSNDGDESTLEREAIKLADLIRTHMA